MRDEIVCSLPSDTKMKGRGATPTREHEFRGHRLRQAGRVPGNVARGGEDRTTDAPDQGWTGYGGSSSRPALEPGSNPTKGHQHDQKARETEKARRFGDQESLRAGHPAKARQLIPHR